ncbi:hypothetical protein FGB62_195g00 [Gracilaria domingensis]|nr:hypothetical protein FGB62_195g00 [Gracilaria domingensis]
MEQGLNLGHVNGGIYHILTEGGIRSSKHVHFYEDRFPGTTIFSTNVREPNEEEQEFIVLEESSDEEIGLRNEDEIGIGTEDEDEEVYVDATGDPEDGNETDAFSQMTNNPDHPLTLDGDQYHDQEEEPGSHSLRPKSHFNQ